MRKFDTIIIHCAATPPHWMAGSSTVAQMKEIDRWHKDRGWSGIGYHYVIGRDGTVVKGRHLNKTGAHTKGHNTGSVGVCLVGGKGGVRTDKFADHFTPEQELALKALISDLCEKYPAIKHIKGHNDYTNLKGCPSFTVSEWLKGDNGVSGTPVFRSVRKDPYNGQKPGMFTEQEAKKGGIIALIVAAIAALIAFR